MHPNAMQQIVNTLYFREKCLKELEQDFDKANKYLNAKLATGQFIDDSDVEKMQKLAERARKLRIACEEDRKYLEFAKDA